MAHRLQHKSMKYTIYVRSLSTDVYEVEADNLEEAKRKYYNNEGIEQLYSMGGWDKGEFEEIFELYKSVTQGGEA